jgi:hypothetical protein
VELPFSTWKEIMLKLCTAAQSDNAEASAPTPAPLSQSMWQIESAQGKEASNGANTLPAAHSAVASGLFQALLPLPMAVRECWLGALWPEVDLRGVRLSCMEWGHVLGCICSIEESISQVLFFLCHACQCQQSIVSFSPDTGCSSTFHD